MLFEVVGGPYGLPFYDPIKSAHSRISQVHGRSGAWVDAISFDEIDVITGVTTQHARWGGDGGDPLDYPPLDDWYYINGIYVEYDRYVDYIQLHVWNRALQKQELPMTF